MFYVSTRGSKNKVTAAEAIVQGLSEDGGLFVPEAFPQVDAATLKEWRPLSYAALAGELLPLFLEEYDPAFLRKAAGEAYETAFGAGAGTTVNIAEGLYALELWHGPTCAFKDYALQLMPRLLVEGKRMTEHTEKTRILVATSGDTGKAALDGYKNLEGVDIIVFYPNDGTSIVQRKQMATQEGDNVRVFAVEGNFDDAQTGVKKVFSDETVREKLLQKNIRLSSANSINWGRLVPQIVYYFYAYFRVLESEGFTEGAQIDFCVPTGNFGDILAGYYAKKMGLPIGKLICASNKNKVLTDFFRTGTYDAGREFYKTASPSMDILISSNLERLLYHVTGDAGKVSEWMASLKETGKFTVSEDILQKIRQDFDCGWTSEEECEETIGAFFAEHNYISDTHTAVALHVTREKKSADRVMVVLSTASPFKFPRVVLKALGEAVPENDFDAIAALERRTGMEAPETLTSLRNKEDRFTRVISAEEIAEVSLA
ncbi:MAG: threonine synthase [Lachnospiraceae bacterium]|nr:threonine synthase [Lachnospiraceae bacterium]